MRSSGGADQSDPSLFSGSHTFGQNGCHCRWRNEICVTQPGYLVRILHERTWRESVALACDQESHVKAMGIVFATERGECGVEVN